jgi:hypothetical protein
MTTDNPAPKVTFLLGAGASVDAGLPVSVDLTKAITRRLEENHRGREVVQALHVAIGAIVAHDTSHGKGAYDGIDVERIFASIRMLGKRGDHELAPFVAAWQAGIDSFAGGSLPSFWASNFKKELFDSRFGDFGLERHFKEGVQALSKNLDSTLIYQRLEQEMIESLVSTLAVAPEKVDYLAPLVEEASSGPVQIATLNYDHSVELLAQQKGLDLDTGIENWRGGYDWTWRRDARVRLLKLHGSLEWRLAMDRSPGQRIDVDQVTVGRGEEDRRSWGSSIGVVFGQGSKLRADGPFLAMLIELDRFLTQTEHLVIVGYSMRDEHINAALRRWVAGHPEGRLSIVDPAFPELDARGQVPFQRSLIEAFCQLDEAGENPLYPRKATDNLDIIRKGARDGLAEVFKDALPGLDTVA